MRRYAVAGTALVLLALMMITGPARAAWVALSNDNPSDQTRLEVTSDTPQRITLTWDAPGVDVNVSGETTTYSMPSQRAVSSEEGVPVISGLIRLPWGHSASLNVTGGEISRLAGTNTVASKTGMGQAPVNPSAWVELGQPGVMRDVTVVPVIIHPVQRTEDGSVYVADHLDISVNVGGRLQGVEQTPPDRPVSRAFWPLYKSMIINNIDDLGERLADTHGTYLIVTSNQYLGVLNDFIQWKKQKGYNVVVYHFDTAPGYNDLLLQLRDYYETLTPQLEYVLLVGDENRGGAAAIPCNRVQNPGYPSENDVTDWSYAYVDGMDYQPEFLIGRWSVGTSTDVLKIASRTVKYEKTAPDIIDSSDPYWHGAALVAGNWSEGGLPPLTPVASTEWVRDWMLHQWGVSGATPLYWRQGQEQTTAQDIINVVNQGALWVTYRGWGNASGWGKPEFGLTDIENLNNRNRLPVLTSFVCNTGDFGNTTYPEGFGERWLVAGTPANPTGAVAVIAPSDLHTRTKFNNPLLSGFYQAVYQEGITNISQALLRAKYELYMGHPNDRNVNGLVQFYYMVYHVLGDPELTMWRHAPKQMDVVLDNQIPYGQGHLTVQVNGQNGPLTGAHVEVMQGQDLAVGGFVDETGAVSLPVNGAQEGELQVTVTHPDYAPVVTPVTVASQASFVGIADWSADAGSDGLASPGESVNLTVTLQNTGTSAVDGVTADLTNANSELVTVSTGNATFGSIAAGGEASNSTPFTFTLNSPVDTGTMLEFDLTISVSGGDSYTGKLWVPTGATQFQYVSTDVSGGDFTVGESPSLTFHLANLGNLASGDVTATLVSWDEAVSVQTSDVTATSVAAGDTGTFGPYQVAVDPNTYRGRTVRFQMEFTSNGQFVDRINFALPLTGAQSTDPLGPDHYGYFAYDNTDGGQNAPEYNWYDLANDSNADVHALDDDDNVTVNLPFDFKYYGRDLPAGSPMTISSNGWVSFNQEEQYTEHFFRNWNLPSSLGPSGTVAVFWDDLKPIFGDPTIHVYTRYIESEGKYVVEWADAMNRFGYENPDARVMEVFELVLVDPAVEPTATGDGVLEMYYNDVSNVDQTNNFATVGIENRFHTVGLEYTYAAHYPDAAAPLENGRAIRFTTDAPDDLNGVGNNGLAATPKEFRLLQNYPNPFNAATELRFNLPHATHVRLSIYNLLGQEVTRLVDRPMTAGFKTVAWQVGGRDISSGMLLVRLEADGQVAWNKMMYVK